MVVPAEEEAGHTPEIMMSKAVAVVLTVAMEKPHKHHMDILAVMQELDKELQQENDIPPEQHYTPAVAEERRTLVDQAVVDKALIQGQIQP